MALDKDAVILIDKLADHISKNNKMRTKAHQLFQVDLINYIAVAIQERFNDTPPTEAILNENIEILKMYFKNRHENPLNILSPMEKEYLALCAEGKSNEEISVILSKGRRTLTIYKENILKKLNAENFLQAIVKAFNIKIKV